MKKSPAFVLGAVFIGLFMACPKQEVPSAKTFQIKIQGHVYDNQTKQPLTGTTVYLVLEIRNEYGATHTDLAKSITDQAGFYSVQCSMAKEPCESGARLYLDPPDNLRDKAGTAIGCTDNLQIIDLYK